VKSFVSTASSLMAGSMIRNGLEAAAPAGDGDVIGAVGMGGGLDGASLDWGWAAAAAEKTTANAKVVARVLILGV